MKNCRLRALDYARAEIGVCEKPPRSNSGPRVNQYLRSAGLGPGYPWCMAFVHFCYLKAGTKLGGYASVGKFEEWAQEHRHPVVARPFKGDLICYRFDSDDWPDHVGIVERVLALRWKGGRFVGWVRTIEGNTAVGDDANGGRVMRRRRWVGPRTKFVRVTCP